MSFICSIVNRQGDNFRRQMFRRNLVEASIIQDSDGNSKSDRYRAYKTKLNEEHVTTCTMDMHQLVNKLFEKYKDEISEDEIMYYRHHLEPSRLHQLLMEIYFFNYTTSAQEFSLLRSSDWYKMLLIMKHDIMHRLNIKPDQLLDDAENNLLLLIMTANIEEITVGEKMYIKNTKYLNEHKDYKKLVERFYSTIVSMNDDIIKKFLINFANSNYRFVLYENKNLLGKDIIVDKYQLIDELLDFLVISNTNMDLSDDYVKGLCD